MNLRQFLAPRAIPIPQVLWDAQLRALPLLAALSVSAQEQLRALCGRFLATKTIAGAGGLEVTPVMQLHIAAQACLPVLQLGLRWYRGWQGIVVYPDAFRVHRKVEEATGLTHEREDDLTGEAWDGGPVVLSWADAGPAQGLQACAASNVVIHEFAHTLDLLDGIADGAPPLDPHIHKPLSRTRWQAALDDAYERFRAGLDLVESEIGPDIDPDSEHADHLYARLPLDPYAANDPAEFFAVSSETYFLQPARIQDAFPQWYGCLDAFYRPQSIR